MKNSTGNGLRALRDHRLAAAIAAVIAGAASAPAYSQQAGGESAQLQDIVVTARRVEERLQDVPISISAFTAEEMARRNINGIADIAKYTSSVSFENYSGGSTPQIIVRGLSQTVLADRAQNVATFVDGVHVQQQGNVDFALLELERVEVLKGPQNSQYGRSAFAGSVNYVPKAPVLGDFDANVALTLGSDERFEGRAGISIPLGDRLAVRVYHVESEFDGTWKNAFPLGDKGVGTTDSVLRKTWAGTDGNLGGYDNRATRVAARFKPVESLTLDAALFTSKIRAEYGPTTQIRPGAVSVWGLQSQTNCSPNAAGTVLQLYCGELKVDENRLIVDPRSVGNYADTRLFTGHAEWEITDWLSATYNFGRGTFTSRQLNHSSIPPNPAREACGVFGTPCTPATAAQGYILFAVGGVTQQSRQHELRFDGKVGEDFRWRVGYYHSTVDDDSLFNSVERRRSLINDPAGQTVVLSLPQPLARFRDENDSMFASVSYDFLNAWTIDVEGRYVDEKRLLVGNPVGEVKFTEFTPRVNLSWKPNEDAMYYGSIAKGAKAGGLNTILAPPGQESYEPETNMTYELGTKQSLFDGRLQLTAALFYIRWKDLQVTTANLLPPLTGTTARPNFIANAAGAKSKGIEIEGLALLSDHWRLNFAASYADPKYDQGTRDAGLGALCNSPTPVCTAVLIPRPPAAPAVVADIGGNQLARSTKTKGALGVEYASNFGTSWDWSARADLSYQGKIYAESLNVAYFPSRTLLDASVTVATPDKRWSAQLWARNLTDEVYAANSFVIGFANFYNPTIGDGRTFGVTARFNY